MIPTPLAEEVVLEDEEEANKFVTSLCKIRECPLLVPHVNFLVIFNELA